MPLTGPLISYKGLEATLAENDKLATSSGYKEKLPVGGGSPSLNFATGLFSPGMPLISDWW